MNLEMEHGWNMGTVLLFHLILFMKQKNRPHVPFLKEFADE